VSRTSDKTFTELRIAQAYMKLLGISRGAPWASVSLAWIGNCEIRLFEGSQPDKDNKTLFWLELFDHGAKLSIDTFSCNEIADAAVIFEDFIAQATDLNKASRSGDAEAQS